MRGSVLLESRTYLLIGEALHPAVRMLDHEPFICSEHPVGDQQRANHIVRHAPACVADHVRVALRESCELCRIEAAVHASDDGKTPRRIVR